MVSLEFVEFNTKATEQEKQMLNLLLSWICSIIRSIKKVLWRKIFLFYMRLPKLPGMELKSLKSDKLKIKSLNGWKEILTIGQEIEDVLSRNQTRWLLCCSSHSSRKEHRRRENTIGIPSLVEQLLHSMTRTIRKSKSKRFGFLLSTSNNMILSTLSSQLITRFDHLSLNFIT